MAEEKNQEDLSGKLLKDLSQDQMLKLVVSADRYRFLTRSAMVLRRSAIPEEVARTRATSRSAFQTTPRRMYSRRTLPSIEWLSDAEGEG